MEFCSGGSIADVYEYCKQTFNEKQIASVCYCVLKGLDHLHSKNITHRDIKGANILLTQAGVAKITDFGVSKIQEKDTKMQTVVGSPYWMAPEVISLGAYTNLADIWSLGITCIEMAEAGPPRGDQHPMRVMRMIPTLPPPTLKEPGKWSKEYQDFLGKCLQVKAQTRPSCKELLKHPFIKSAKKTYKKDLKALVTGTITTVTSAKRDALKQKMEEAGKEEEKKKKKENMENLLSNSQFISLNSRKRSVRTFVNVTGNDFGEDLGTVIYRGGDDKNTGTVLITDTNAEGDVQSDAFGVDTVIIRDVDGMTGTVIIKE